VRGYATTRSHPLELLCLLRPSPPRLQWFVVFLRPLPCVERQDTQRQVLDSGGFEELLYELLSGALHHQA
jgi:hypothetical protein